MTDEQKAALVERVAKRLNSVRFYWTCGVRTECAEGRGCESCLSKEATAIVNLVLGEVDKHD